MRLFQTGPCKNSAMPQLVKSVHYLFTSNYKLRQLQMPSIPSLYTRRSVLKSQTQPIRLITSHAVEKWRRVIQEFTFEHDAWLPGISKQNGTRIVKQQKDKFTELLSANLMERLYAAMICFRWTWGWHKGSISALLFKWIDPESIWIKLLCVGEAVRALEKQTE